jgi:hypothetical protein
VHCWGDRQGEPTKQNADERRARPGGHAVKRSGARSRRRQRRMKYLCKNVAFGWQSFRSSLSVDPATALDPERVAGARSQSSAIDRRVDAIQDLSWRDFVCKLQPAPRLRSRHGRARRWQRRDQSGCRRRSVQDRHGSPRWICAGRLTAAPPLAAFRFRTAPVGQRATRSRNVTSALYTCQVCFRRASRAGAVHSAEDNSACDWRIRPA